MYIRSSFWIIVGLALLVQAACLAPFVAATKMHYIHWNTSNPIFRIDNTDHIIDVNKGNVAYEYDQVNIICPVYSEETSEDDAEKYIIYNVSKEEYETCHITNASPRIIAVCDKPYKLMYFTITFRSFTPQPGGLEFRPGQDYYFISTSSKDDLHRRIGGRCTTHNMKVVFKVCCDPASQPAQDQANSHFYPEGVSTPPSGSPVNVTSITEPIKTVSLSTNATSTTTSTISTLSTTLKTTYQKNNDYHTYKKNPGGNKKKPDPSENEVVKNEELSTHSGVAPVLSVPRRSPVLCSSHLTSLWVVIALSSLWPFYRHLL